MKRDYYEVLGVDKNVSDSELKSAYRRKAKKYHPDLNPDVEDSEAKIKELNEAYEVLSDPEKRSRYDRFGHDGIDPSSFSGFDMGDIFSDLFDIFGMGNQRDRQNTGPKRGRDLRYDMTIEFEEAIFGAEKEIVIRREEECERCHGSGAEPGTSKSTCPECHGSGEVNRQVNTPFGRMMSRSTCSRCGGSGEVIEEPCKNCHGSGREYVETKIKVNIPKGVDNGTIMSVRGEGEAGIRGGSRGDLYIYIRVLEDELFTRHGLDIYIEELPISFAEATLGAMVQIPTLEGKVEFKIPEGTETGSVFKLEGRGVQEARRKRKGDLYFSVKIETPKKLSHKQKELLLEFSKAMDDDFKESKKSFFEKVKDAFK